jgi:hypothetical protein
MRSTVFCIVVYFAFSAVQHRAEAVQPQVLHPADYAHYVAEFNAADAKPVENLVSNAAAWEWMSANVPLLDCPDRQLEETYYFRWWVYRKHICQTPSGRVVTEFLTPVSHAGPYNTISCAFGHHVAEGRWLGDRQLLDEYARFWFRSGPGGKPAAHFHKYSSWAAAALYDRYLVTSDRDLVVDLLDDLIEDFAVWKAERARPDGLFWQYDVRDGMEESICGSRRAKNIRPTINSYMAANAAAISKIARLAGRQEVAQEFAAKSEALRRRMIDALWDPEARFFKVRQVSESPDVSKPVEVPFADATNSGAAPDIGKLCDAREAIGYVPWMFELAEPDQAVAWREIRNPAGFLSPCGLTTAERRHAEFRTHGTGTCEWDGAVWPFATSQTLTGLAHVLRGPAQPYVSRGDFYEQLLTYSRAHQQNGRPYIGEYHDEITGKWLITGPKAERSRYYNHSTFCDLVISGLVGLVPRADDTIEVDPLLPADAWDWFCLDGAAYHGHDVTIVWDRDGQHYKRGAGLAAYVDGAEIARADRLERLTGKLPPSN